MAYYRDKVTQVLLIDKLVERLTTTPSGATEPYWKQVQSGPTATEGYILYSKGKSGKDNIYIRLYQVPNSRHYISLSILEDYKPNPIGGLVGTMVNEIQQNLYYANSNVSTNTQIRYFLSFDKNKVMLALSAVNVGTTYGITGLMYVGLPTRINEEKDSTAGVITTSTTFKNSSVYANAGQVYVLKNRAQAVSPIYTMVTMSGIGRSKGWGGHVLLPTIYLQGTNETIRSVLDGVSPIYQNTAKPDFSHGDEITVGTKRYTVFFVNKMSVRNGFPSDWVAVEQLL